MVFKIMFFTFFMFLFHEDTPDRCPELLPGPSSLLSQGDPAFTIFYTWEFHPTGHLYHFQCLKPLMQKCAALAERRPTSCVFSGEAGTEMQSHRTVDSKGADLIRAAKRCGPLSWHLGFINKCISTSAHAHLIRHPVGKVHPYLSVHKCNVYHKSTMLSKWTKPDQIQVICTCSQEHSKTIAQLF